MRKAAAVFAVVAFVVALVYFHHHGGLSRPGACPTEAIVYDGGC